MHVSLGPWTSLVVARLFATQINKSGDDILWNYYSNGTSSVVLLHETIYYLESSLTVESVVDILRCEHSSDTSAEVLSHGAICLVCSSSFKFRV